MSYRRGSTKFPCKCNKCGWKGQRVRPKRWPVNLVTARDCPKCKSRHSVEIVNKKPVDTSKGWGGARPHPKGQGDGRPKNEHPLQLIKIACTPGELAQILSQIPDTRRRAEILLRATG